MKILNLQIQALSIHDYSILKARNPYSNSEIRVSLIQIQILILQVQSFIQTKATKLFKLKLLSFYLLIQTKTTKVAKVTNL